MANILRIKRRLAAGGAGAPAALKNAELAYNEASNILYYGSGDDGSGNATSIIAISGAGAYVDLSSNQSIGGTKTFTGILDADGATNVYVPTVSTTTNDTSAASTAFVRNAITGYAVTSVGLSLPNIFTVSNSPVTTTGTLTATLADQAANKVFAGPSTGADAAPTFRSLTATDIPTLTAAKISDFDTQVRTNRLDQLAAPTASVSFNGQKITGLATPVASTDAANKGYVDNAVAGLNWKQAVNLLADSNVALTGTDGTLVIDGHAALTSADVGYRLLLTNQTTSSEEGIYEYTVSGGNYTLNRTTDADTYQELIGAAVFVLEGTLYANTAWVQSDHYLASFSGQDWVQFSGSGTYVAGAGLTLTGNIFAVGTASVNRIVVNADNIDLATVAQTNTTGTAGLSFVQSHTVDSYGRITGTVTADVQDGTTSAKGVVSLTDSTSSTSTTTAATPASVKSAYDLANAALPKAGGTMTGTINLAAATSGGLVPLNFAQSSATPPTPIDGDFWLSGDVFHYYNGAATKTIAYTDSNITGTSANVTGVVAAANGGTGISSYTIGDLLYATGATTLGKLADVATGNVLLSGGVATAPSWGKVGLTTHVSGILALANGGTGADLSGSAAGTIFKTNGSNFVAATAGTDYLNDQSTIDGGTF